MRMVMMSGGLGNQIFHYIFLRYLEEKTGEKCFVDDTYFHQKHPAHNGYDLENAFMVSPPLLSKRIGEEEIQEIANLIYPETKNVVQGTVADLPNYTGRKDANQFYPGAEWPEQDIISTLAAHGLLMTPVQEGDHYMRSSPGYSGPIYSFPKGEFSPEVSALNGDLYYYGFWENSFWFCEIEDIIRRELQFRPICDEKVLSLYEEMQSEKSVAVHIRRGSFIIEGYLMNPKYYVSAISDVRKRIENPIFYIFSNDLEYVKTHLEEYGFTPEDECVFVEGNTGKKDYVDMQLMTACRGIITANSTFSYAAAVLSDRADLIAYKPDKPRWGIVPEKMPGWIILPREGA